MTDVIFKASHKGQLSCLPPTYDELVPKNHPVRLVNEIIEKIDITDIIKATKEVVHLVTIHECY